MIAENIINSSKRTDMGEIILTLFELCDLNCLFCNQDHNSIFGLDTVLDKIEQVKQTVEVLRKNKNKTNFVVNIMGGEIFSDRVPDKTFDDYATLVDLIRGYATEQEITIEPRFVTNFVWHKKDRVRNLIEKTKTKMGTSYDPAGRFNKEQFEIFQANVREFTPYIKGANVIMTKQNIEKFMKGQVPFFDYMYENFNIYFDYYTPERNMNVLMPKDVELRDFIKLIVDKYPNCHPFVDFKIKTKKSMTCMDTFTIMPDASFGSCSILLTDLKEIKFIPSKRDLEEQWFEEYNCLSCEHFSRCSLGCFLSNHIKGSRTQKECWLKEVYDYVDEKTKREKL